MRTLHKLLDVQDIILKLYNSTFVLVEITVVGCRENSDDSWKLIMSKPFIHSKTFSLCLMSPDDRNQFIFLEKVPA